MQTKNVLIASAGSEAQLLKMVQGYFYSPNIFFADGMVNNSTGALKSYQVKEARGRWRFERIPEGGRTI